MRPSILAALLSFAVTFASVPSTTAASLSSSAGRCPAGEVKMSNTGTTISQPINLAADVYKVLGIAPQNGVYDIGYACSNNHGKTNKWSKYKPIHFNKIGILTNAERISANHGLTLSNATFLDSKINGYTDWTYSPPTGGSGSPYRITDFANTDEQGYTGYNQNAVAPMLPYADINNPNVVLWDSAAGYYPRIIPSYKYTRSQMQGTTSNMELLLSEFTDKLNNGKDIGNYVVAVLCVVGTGLYVANSFNNIKRSLSSDLLYIDFEDYKDLFGQLSIFPDEHAYTLYPVINPIEPGTYGDVIGSGTNGRHVGRFIPFPGAPTLKLVKTSLQTISMDPAGGNVLIRNTRTSTGVMMGQLTIPFQATTSSQPNTSTMPQVPSGMIPTYSTDATAIIQITVTLNNTKSRTKVVDGVTVSAAPRQTTINARNVHISNIAYADTNSINGGGGSSKVVCAFMQDLSVSNSNTTQEITIEAGKSKKVMMQFNLDRGWGVGFPSGAPYLGLTYNLFINSNSEQLALDTNGAYFFKP